MTPTSPRGTSLRFLLLAWGLDPGVSVADYADYVWLVDRLRDSDAILTPAEYLPLAPRFRAWGRRQGIAEVITRVEEDAGMAGEKAL